MCENYTIQEPLCKRKGRTKESEMYIFYILIICNLYIVNKELEVVYILFTITSTNQLSIEYKIQILKYL